MKIELSTLITNKGRKGKGERRKEKGKNSKNYRNKKKIDFWC